MLSNLLWLKKGKPLTGSYPGLPSGFAARGSCESLIGQVLAGSVGCSGSLCANTCSTSGWFCTPVVHDLDDLYVFNSDSAHPNTRLYGFFGPVNREACPIGY